MVSDAENRAIARALDHAEESINLRVLKVERVAFHAPFLLCGVQLLGGIGGGKDNLWFGHVGGLVLANMTTLSNKTHYPPRKLLIPHKGARAVYVCSVQ